MPNPSVLAEQEETKCTCSYPFSEEMTSHAANCKATWVGGFATNPDTGIPFCEEKADAVADALTEAESKVESLTSSLAIMGHQLSKAETTIAALKEQLVIAKGGRARAEQTMKELVQKIRSALVQL